MAVITSKIEPKIVLPEHEVTMLSTNEEQVGHPLEYNREYMQTRVHGIMAPLIFLNGLVVDYDNLISFALDWTKMVPTIKFEFVDPNNSFARYAKPGLSNEIQVQILPAHDNTYRKINLLFYVTSIHIVGDTIQGEASYKVMDFVQTKYESLGQKSTYELCEYIAQQTGMGLASNMEGTEDKRYIQAREESYEDLLMNEVEESLANQDVVQEAWVDLWNNLVLANMYDRFESLDGEEDMQVWIRSGFMPDATASGESEVPTKSLALFTNAPTMAGSELAAEDYIQHTSGSGGYASGTSKASCTYMEATHSWSYSYSSDGDVNKDEFLNSEYTGEVYGDYNQIRSRENRDTFLKKMNSERLSIFTSQPLLGINRGDQVRVLWYDSNDNLDINDEYLRKRGLQISKEDPGLGWIGAMDNIADPDLHLRVNYQVSGQYTVIGVYITWTAQKWDVEYILTKPARQKIDLIETYG